MSEMQALIFRKNGPIDADTPLELARVAKPVASARDLLIKVEALSMNPVDTKIRSNRAPAEFYDILGYDAVGVVEAVGEACELFKVGDKVWYAGAVNRYGSNAEFQIVDERIVGPQPTALSNKAAAALPLTSITAWEILFDALGLEEGQGEGKDLLIIGGAGGVGSILIQLAKALTNLRVIATASREETREWCAGLGADIIIDHRKPLADQLAAHGSTPHYVACLTATDIHWQAVCDLIAPQGKIAVIDDPETLDIKLLKPKSASVAWEFMFTRSLFGTDDMITQHQLLTRVSQMVDDGKIKTTMTKDMGALTLESMIEAHKIQESGRMIGKMVFDGFHG